MVGMYIKGKKDAPGEMECRQNVREYKHLKIYEDFLMSRAVFMSQPLFSALILVNGQFGKRRYFPHRIS